MPSDTQMILESWPPISRMVRTSGCRWVVPTAWAVISFLITEAPSMAPTRRRARPVVPAPTISTPAPSTWRSSSRTTFFDASVGLPSVHKYERAMMARFSSMITPFVEMEPMSMPR